MSVVVSAIAGYVLLMGLSAAAPDLAAAGSFVNPVLYILESRLSYVLGTLLFAVIAVAQLFCGMSSVTSNSRMIYAFSRDGAVPFHNVWHSLDSGRTPRNAILLAVVCSFNYTPVVVLGTFLIITIWWLASARTWFKGPVAQGSEEQLAAIERSVGETIAVNVEGATGGKLALLPPNHDYSQIVSGIVPLTILGIVMVPLS
jgi:hypothetical protein